MNSQRLRINIYFLVCGVVSLVCGCTSSKSGSKYEASVRLHLEANWDGTDRAQVIKIGKSEPFSLSVETRSFLTEFNLDRATIIDDPGGFVIALQFDREGSWILEQYSTANKGKRVAIFAEFGEIRWLAAPVMRDRIVDGHLVFTPDATREEAERIIRGANIVAEKVRKGRK